jgi:hypothetical protein
MAQRQPSAEDQLMLEFINRARANPQAEANRLLGGNLNEGVAPADTISLTPKQPLAFNLYLNDAAQKHSQWMLNNDVFSHTGSGGSTAQERMENAGYEFVPSWSTGENIAWQGTTAEIDLTQSVIENYDNLFIDQGYPGRGHRVNILQSSFQEVGISSLEGRFTDNNVTYNAVMTTQDFAFSSNVNAFLTGVVYTDQIVNDDFYTVGEGIGGISITATNINNPSQTFTTSTWQSGGYSLELPNGNYSITFVGDLDSDLQEDVVTTSATINGENVKLDLTPDSSPTSNPNLKPTPNPPPTPNPDSLLQSPIFRFQNKNQPGTYLFAGEAESANIRENFPEFEEEGFAFFVGIEAGDDLIPMYRFQNTLIPGTYLYAGDMEAQNIRRNFTHFREEGIAFYVYGADANQGEDIYRFQNIQVPGTYLFVTNSERQNILQNFLDFQEEGVAFEVNI